MNSFVLYGGLALVLLLAGVYVAISLRGGSRLQRRLFTLFFLLSFLPVVVVLLLNWQMSQRNLGFLDSPGLRSSLESSLNLARRTLDREREVAGETGQRVAQRIADGERPLPAPPDGGSYRCWVGGEAHLRGTGASELLEAMAPPDPNALGTPIRLELTGEDYLVATAAAHGPEGEVRLHLATPLAADLAADLRAVTQGSSRYRQLRLFYGELLRGDTLITLTGLGVVLLATSILLSRYFARRIAGPLSKLTRGTELVAAGDLDHRVRVRAVDELGDLVDAFNRMTGELKRSKDELVRAERVAAWQGIARRLAHEIKNPLTPIDLAMHRIRRKVDDGTVHECVDTVLEETRNLKRLADEFSFFARLPAPKKERTELRELVSSVAELYTERTHVEVVWEGWPEEMWVHVDPGQMRQVFGNLVKNAAEAMRGRGRVTLTLGEREGGIVVRVADAGPGLTARPEQLFEPYFTTKESGTGLGLAVARKIVEDHGGSLHAYAPAEGGAVFEVGLPAAGKE